MSTKKIRIRPVTFIQPSKPSPPLLKECVSIRICPKVENASHFQKSTTNKMTCDSTKKIEMSDRELQHQRLWSVTRSRDCESKLSSSLYVRKLPETKSPLKVPNSQKHFNRFED